MAPLVVAPERLWGNDCSLQLVISVSKQAQKKKVKI
jgi:hypothetical protein